MPDGWWHCYIAADGYQLARGFPEHSLPITIFLVGSGQIIRAIDTRRHCVIAIWAEGEAARSEAVRRTLLRIGRQAYIQRAALAYLISERDYGEATQQAQWRVERKALGILHERVSAGQVIEVAIGDGDYGQRDLAIIVEYTQY